MSNSAKQIGINRAIRPVTQQKKNYSNANFHSAVDLAKFYSGQVDSHLEASKFENHVLSSISRSYKPDQIGRSKSQSAIRSRQIKNRGYRKEGTNTKLSHQDLAQINPQRNLEQSKESKSLVFEQDEQVRDKKSFILVRQALNYRAQRVPEYSSSLRSKCDEKKSLMNYIADLKRRITQQKKLKTKISLNCNKIMNKRQLLYANTTKKQQQNYHLFVKISQQSQNCSDLRSEIQQTTIKLQTTQKNRQQQRDLRNRVKKYVQQTRIVLRGQQRDVAQLKQWQSASYHNMNNSYQHVNQYKQQKALLLAQIDSNYIRHGASA